MVVFAALNSPLIAALTTFSYTQTDISTGSGTIAAPAPSTVGAVTITWAPVAMPAATVRDPAGAGSVGGAVGGFDAEAGDNSGNGEDVAIYWNSLVAYYLCSKCDQYNLSRPYWSR